MRGVFSDTGFLADVYWPVKEPPERPEFTTDNLLWLIEQRAVKALWETAVQCPCGHKGENAPDETCPFCGNEGYIYPKSQVVRVVVVGISDRVDLYGERGNIMTPGRASFACKYEHAPTLLDRITLLDNRISFSDLLERKSTVASPVERLRYPVFAQAYRKRTDPEPWDGPATGSIDVVYLIPQAADGYPLRDSHGALKPLVKGTDFDLTVNGWIDWTKGDVLHTAPEPGAQFAIYYKTKPVFRVLDYPQVSRDTMTKLKLQSEAHQFLPVEFSGQLEWMWRAA